MSSDRDSDTALVRLDGAQRAIRDAFFGHDSGLFVLESDPGTGKSTTSEHVAAEYLVRAWAAGVDAPEETLAFVSFTRDDAAAIGPGIADALETLARDPQHDVDIAVEDARELGRRARRATNVGTVDSVLGGVFAAVATEVGFEEVPAVSSGDGLRSVRAACLRRLEQSAEHAERLRRLKRAYPEDEHRADAADLLREAQLACRERRLSVSAFRDRLETVVEETYPGGAPDSLADVRRAIESFVDRETAATYASGPAAEPSTRADVVTADGELYESWTTAVDDLCTLLERYEELYDEAARRTGVVSHLDVAHWVAAFFTRDEFESPFRKRLQSRYTDRLSAVVVDEAQDVSAVQHAALAGLVDRDTRVLLVGDCKQCIFLWRNARPGLFRTAIDDGRYFDVDWTVHAVEHEQRTRRCRPGVAAAVDTVFDEVFTDPCRGGGGAVVGSRYSCLEPTRAETDVPNVHVAAVTADTVPGHARYISTDEGVGEATALARCLADGLADGSFADPADPADEQPTVTVLFARRRNVDAFTAAFEREGLAVADATESLFGSPLARLLADVCVWLAAPDGDSLRTLAASPLLEGLGVGTLFDLQSWSVEAVAGMDADGRTAVAFVQRLAGLLDRRSRFETQSPSAIFEAIVDELGLWQDDLGLTADAERRVAVLDGLMATVDRTAWASAGLADLGDLFAGVRDTPTGGSTLSTVDEAACDVVFRTIHAMKGAEDDVVALADLGQHVAQYGPHTDTLSTLGDHLALSPPDCEAAADVPALPGFEHGLFDIDRKPWDLDAGLRWTSQRWNDDGRLAGSPPLRALSAANRAERWRLLYVALTRARNHLVLPLPTRRERPTPRDRWVDTLRETLQFDETRTSTYACPTPSGGTVDIRVHFRSTAGESPAESAPASQPFVTTDARRDVPPWTPRFVNPSTLYPFLEAPDAHVLDYLQRRPLHSEHGGVADDLPLTFETMGPEDVGDVGHAVLATAVRQGVDTETLRTCGGVLARKLQYTLADRAGRVSADERERLRRFVADVVCPQFADSRLWQRLQSAQMVYVEEPVDALVRIDGLDREIQGVADVVSVDETGTWRVDEIKLTLQPSDAETQARYRLQAQVYAWSLSAQLGGASVTPGITQLGVEERTQVVSWRSDAVRSRLDELP